jgi:hypothetical protein
MERIFVQIASYRDPELSWTLRDLFAKAAHPERVFVGICLQINPAVDLECEPMAPRPRQVRCVRYHALESRGACWARSQASGLWQGEEFVLQIDSHTRFVLQWDTKLLATLAACPSRKPVLSTYPAPYYPPDLREEHSFYLLLPMSMDEWGTLLLGSIRVPLAKAPSQPPLGALCGGCFLFGPAQILSDVPYDPYLYFIGEEIATSVRLWTHGWDIYHPNRNLLFHYWYRNYRRTHWSDSGKWTELDRRSRQRVNALLALEPCDDPAAVVELERYGLGGARSLAAYQAFSGIDFARKQIAPYPLWAGVYQREWQQSWVSHRRRQDLW